MDRLPELAGREPLHRDPHLLSALAGKGIDVQGVDASPSVLHYLHKAIRDRVASRDLSQPQRAGRSDLVISTGVAKHLPKRTAPAHVEKVARHAKRRVFFPAAGPGQWGDGHINCQPQEYWIDLFGQQGLEHDPAATERLSAACAASEPIREALPWLLGIIMVFERPS